MPGSKGKKEGAAGTQYKTIEQLVGNTPMALLRNIEGVTANGNKILVKLEGVNPTLSVKARGTYIRMSRLSDLPRLPGSAPPSLHCDILGCF